MNKEFEEFVKAEMGDIAVFDNGRYISPKIQAYYKVWCAAFDAGTREAYSLEYS